MPFDTKTFSAIEDADTKYRLQAVNDNAKLIMEIEELIRYQYELHERTASYLNGKYPRDSSFRSSLIDKRIAIASSLYTQNVETIHAVYTLILTRKTTASQSLIRKIYESISTQYYVGLCDDDDFIIYVNSTDEKNTTKTRLGYNHYKQKLYDGDTKDSMSKVYSNLSEFTHSSWRTLLDVKYDKAYVENPLLTLRYISLFNVISYCQVYVFDKEFLKELLEFVQPFVDEQVHNSNYQLYDMFPNHKNIVDRLVFKKPITK